MKKIITYCFDKWWIPLIFTFCSGVFFILSHIQDSAILENTSFYILLIAWILLLISTIYQLVNKKWIQGVITGVCFFGVLGAFIVYAIIMFLIEQTEPDRFTEGLYIPADIKIEEPVDLPFADSRRPDSILAIKKTQTDFIIYNSFQPGLYEYDIWLKKTEQGKIYLKAYEITRNYKLSADRLKERSTVTVYNPTDSIARFGTKNTFTIYEGDWGEPYAARFEVWFVPDNANEERKLLEKNFIIEGWMR